MRTVMRMLVVTQMAVTRDRDRAKGKEKQNIHTARIKSPILPPEFRYVTTHDTYTLASCFQSTTSRFGRGLKTHRSNQ
jgi:hypothetical protein